MSAKYASACVSRLLDADTIVVNEYPLVLEEIQVRSPCRYYASAPAGGLGWGLGAALGAKLAAPDKSVVCCVGDGAYMFGNPTASHFVSEAIKLPVLFVVFNNARWAAVHRSTLAMYPKGVAAGMAEPPFATLEPSPRFEKTIEASGGYGVRVERVEDLMPALERALTVVKTERRQALVNLRLEAGYVKTS
jgi:acetolactate synthase-1/2/3 large subunit